MKNFTTTIITRPTYAQPYLTAKDQKSPREWMTIMLTADSDDDIIELAKKIARTAERNKRIALHEKQMEVVRGLLNGLETGEAFLLRDLADAITTSPETMGICENGDYGKKKAPLGAIRTVINEMISAGTLKKVYAETMNSWRKKNVYVKK